MYLRYSLSVSSSVLYVRRAWPLCLVLFVSLSTLFQPVKVVAQASEKPCLILQKKDVLALQGALKTLPIVGESFATLKEKADLALKNEIVVPIPVDPAGGYTHEKHKSNYYEMYAAGIAYQLTADIAYAKFIGDMLLKYADLYPTLGKHPEAKSEFSGKLFWQNLNEAVWLVYAIQAYDCAYDEIASKDRKKIEDNVFRKVANHLSVVNRSTFDKIHNHATWSSAGVGMTGYVLGDTTLVNRSIFGTKGDQKTGFLKQIYDLFSPDGYYAEGPYYQRYALMPFMLFAQAIQNNQPELKIFEFKDGVLGKAVNTVLQMTDDAGFFFPLNDGLAHKSYQSEELVAASNIAFAYYKDTNLLSIVREHNRVMISGAGLAAALGLDKKEPELFKRVPALIRDGFDGNSGGLALLRTPFKGGSLTGVVKYTTQGMGHGHFDRLSLVLFDGKNAVLPDYGAARFLNVPSKHGGRYLPENDSWANQTVAHNTVVVDETTQSNDNWKTAQKTSPVTVFYDNSQEIQIVNTKDTTSYKGVVMQRITALVKAGNSPFLIDLFNVASATAHKYDYVFHYGGHLMGTSFPYQAHDKALKPLGEKAGYQHLWLEAEGQTDKKTGTFTWWLEKQFYSITTIADSQTKFLLTRAGANDPEFNLRHQPSFIIRQEAKKAHLFASIIEPHGSFNPTLELVQSPDTRVTNFEVVYKDVEKAVVLVSFGTNDTYRLCIAFAANAQATYKVEVANNKIEWTGNYSFEKIK